MAKREFGDGPIFTITNYIFWFFLCNLYFWLVNPLQLILLISANPANLTKEYGVLLFLFSIPMGPALAAALSVMSKLIRENDLNVTKDFFRAYKANFKQALIVWLLEMLVFIIIYTDATFFSKSGFGLLVYPLYAFGILVFLMGLYAYPLITRFYLKTKDVLKLSFIYSIKRFKVTILCVFTFVIAGFLLSTPIASISALFLISLMCYLIMFYQKDVLKEIELTMGQTGSSSEVTSENTEDEELIFKDVKEVKVKKKR